MELRKRGCLACNRNPSNRQKRGRMRLRGSRRQCKRRSKCFVTCCSAFPLGWLLFWAKVVVLVLLVTVVAATHARYRIDHAIRFFAGLFAVALGALVLASYGY